MFLAEVAHLRLRLVGGFWGRLVGGACSRDLLHGLILTKCCSVHTFWGWPLSSIVFIDRYGEVLRVIRPRRWRFYSSKDAYLI